MSTIYYCTAAAAVALSAVILALSSRNSQVEKNSSSLPEIRSSIPLTFGITTLLAFLRNPSRFMEDARKQHGPAYAINVLGKKFVFIHHPITLATLERQTTSINDLREIQHAAVAASGLPLSKTSHMVDVMLSDLMPILIRNFAMDRLSEASSHAAFTQALDIELSKITTLNTVSVKIPNLTPGTTTKLPLFDFISATMYRTASLFIFGPTYPRDTTLPDFLATFNNVSLLASPLRHLPLPCRRARDRLLNHLIDYLRPCYSEFSPDADCAATATPDAVSAVLVDANALVVDCIVSMRAARLSLREAGGVLLTLLMGFHPNLWFHTTQLLGRLLLEDRWRTRAENEARAAPAALSGITVGPAYNLTPETPPSPSTTATTSPTTTTSPTRRTETLPFLESAMWEALRRPFRLLQIRSTVEDVHVSMAGRRYLIERNAYILPRPFNHDPEIYPEPFAFKADRFLDPKVPKPRTWGEGHRVCKGRDLARWEMLEFTATCFRRFDMRLVDAQDTPLTDPASFKPEGSVVLTQKAVGIDGFFIELKHRPNDETPSTKA